MYVSFFSIIFFCLAVNFYFLSNVSLALPLGHPWLSLLCILFFCGGIATFVSHTVAAIILLPLIARIGVSLAIPEVVVVGSAFASNYILFYFYFFYMIIFLF